jgi:hypothetical protein
MNTNTIILPVENDVSEIEQPFASSGMLLSKFGLSAYTTLKDEFTDVYEQYKNLGLPELVFKLQDDMEIAYKKAYKEIISQSEYKTESQVKAEAECDAYLALREALEEYRI